VLTVVREIQTSKHRNPISPYYLKHCIDFGHDIGNGLTLTGFYHTLAGNTSRSFMFPGRSMPDLYAQQQLASCNIKEAVEARTEAACTTSWT